MLKMHPTGGVVAPKVNRPPPPVPPRPAKSLVQEALAKSRIGLGSTRPSSNRMAPVPPPPTTRPLPEITKNSQTGKKPAPRVPSPLYDTIEIDKVSSRPVVYQSENLRKPERILTDKNSVDTSRKLLVINDKFKQDVCTDEIKKPVTKTESFKINDDVKRSINRISSFRHEEIKSNNSENVVVRNNSIKLSGDIKRPISKAESFKTVEINHKKPLGRAESYISCDTVIKLPRVNSFKSNPSAVVKRNPSLKRSNSKKFDRGHLIQSERVKDSRVDLKEDVNKESDFRKEIVIENGSFDEDSKSQFSTLDKSTVSSKDSAISTSSSRAGSEENKNWDKMLQDKNHVNTLIDEMFASVLEVNDDKLVKKDANDNRIIIPNKMVDNITINTKSADNLTVIVISDESSDDNKSFSSSGKSNSSTNERKTKLNDNMNHEFLIQELQNMKNDQDKILKRQRLPSLNIYKGETTENVTVNGEDKIHTSDWYGVSEEGKEVKMSSCHITIEDPEERHMMRSDEKGLRLDFDRISKMSQFHGLPPLPKSLSGFSFMEHHPHPNPPTPVRTSSMRSNQGPQLTPTHLTGSATNLGHSPHAKLNGDGKKVSSLDAQLAILRREMYSLRQQDISLLSQLWSLNESIQDFRQMLQDQDDRVLSPPSPSPTQSSIDDDEEYYMSAQSMGYRPSPMVSRKLSGSSGASGSLG